MIRVFEETEPGSMTLIDEFDPYEGHDINGKRMQIEYVRPDGTTLVVDSRVYADMSEDVQE